MLKRNLIFTFTVFIAFAACFVHQIEHHDFFTHLAAGKTIWQKQSLKLTEPFTFLYTGQIWKNLFWGGDLSYYIAFVALGMAGVVFLTWAIYVVSSLIIFHKTRHILQNFVFVLAFLPILSPGPHNFVVLYSAALIFLCQDQNYRKFPWALPVLFIFWTNTHPSFLFGIASALLLLLLDRHFDFKTLMPIALSGLISPYGYTTWGDAIVYCQALQQFSLHTWPGFWGIVLLAAISLWHQRKNLPNKEIVLFVVWCCFAVYSYEWSIAIAVLCCYWLAENFFAQHQEFCAKKLVRVPSFALCGLLIAVMPWGGFGTWGVGINQEKISSASGKFLEDIGFSGRLLNEPETGGVLEWHQQQVFLDTRKHYFLSEDTLELVKAQMSPDYLPQLARKFEIKAVVLSHQNPKNRFLLNWLSLQSDWNLVFSDPLTSIFMENSPSNQQWIGKHSLIDGNIPESNSASAALYYNYSRVLIEMTWLQSAKQALEKAIKLQENCADRLVIEGYLALLEEDLTTAQQKIQESRDLALLSKNTLLLLFRYFAYLDMQQQEQRELARAWIQYLQKYFPNDPEIAIYFTQILDKEGDKATARAQLISLTKKYPHYQAAKDYLENFEKVLEIGTSEAQVIKARGLRRSGKLEEAMRLLNTLVQDTPENAEALLERGKIWRGYKKYDLAFEDFRKALYYTGSKGIEPSVQLALTFIEIGKWREADKLIRPFLEEHGTRSDIRQTLLKIEANAIPELRSKIKEFPEEYSYRRELAEIFIRFQRYEEAIDVLNAAQIKDKKFRAELYFKYGQQQINAAKVKEGIKNLERSVDIWPEYLDAHHLIATIALKLRDWELAEKHFRYIQKVAPTDERGELGIALIELGKGIELQIGNKFDDAINHFEKYLEMTPAEDKEEIKKRIESIRVFQLNKVWDKAEEHMRNQKWQEAAKQYQLYTRIVNPFSSKLPEAYWKMSVCLHVAKEYHQEMEALVKLLAIDPGLADAHLNLGVLYYNHDKNVDKAREHLEHYLKLANPEKHADKIAQVKKFLEKLE